MAEVEASTGGLAREAIQEAFARQPLFEDKTWQLSPKAWPLTAKQVQEIERIGQACLDFQIALERLYLRASEGRNLLRNAPLEADWAVELLDRGKPSSLLDHARSKALKGAVPAVIRPDLLLTEEGFVLTEIDSVPGGLGLTAFLGQMYQESGDTILGDADALVDGFYEALASQVPGERLPCIALAVSDEAATYRPEMDWVAEQLQRKGRRVYAVHPDDLFPMGGSLNLNIDGNPEQVHLVYRFWELFDAPNVPLTDYLLEALGEGTLVVSPPMRPFQEEKLALALFHHPKLGAYWNEALPKGSRKVLKKIIPRTWVVEPVDLPHSAVLHAPEVGGAPIWDWRQLGDATQKERNLILKRSGFHETAWGARSVTLGSDVSATEWAAAIDEALAESAGGLYVLQDYRKPMRLKHPVYPESGDARIQEGRLRLSPFYTVQGQKATLQAALATFCPPDKKIIHGMRDAAMLPCRIEG